MFSNKSQPDHQWYIIKANIGLCFVNSYFKEDFFVYPSNKIQWGFRYDYPDARYSDAAVNRRFYLGTDFVYVILSHLSGIRGSGSGRSVCFYHKTLFLFKVCFI